MIARNCRFTILITLVVVLLSGSAGAGTVVYDLSRFKADDWEISHPEYVKVEPDGLHVRIPKPGVTVSVVLKRHFEDEFDMKLRFRQKDPVEPTHLKIGFFLENPEENARTETNYHTEWWTDGKSGKRLPGCRMEQFIRQQGKDLVKGGGFDHGVISGFRFVKTDTHVWPFHFGDHFHWHPRRRWLRGLYGTFRTDEETVDRFRPGFYVSSYHRKNAAVEVVFSTLEVWSTLVPSPGAPPDPKVKRFDFGPVGQQLSEDYTPVTHRVKYSPRRGWGWANPREPIDLNYHLPAMTNKEAKRLGLPHIDEGTTGENDRPSSVNYMKYHRKSYMAAWSHGGDFVSYFKRWMDLKTPLERDHVGVGRPYGFPFHRPIEADQWEIRGAIYVDDDLSTTFNVDLPNDRYTLLIGVGYNLNAPPGRSPFSLDAEGVTVKKLGGNWRRCVGYRVDDVEVKDGQLNLRFHANRRLAMNIVSAWNVGVSWHVNYLAIIPSERRELIEAEEWRIIKDRGLKVRQVTFAPGPPAQMVIRDGHVVVRGKPFVPMLWQAHHPGDTQRHYPYYLWGNTDAIANASANFTGSQHFMKSRWFKLSAADNYPWRTIVHLNWNHTDGKLALIRVDGLLTFMPRRVAGEGGALQDARGRSNRWNVKPPLNSRLGREIQREAYSMVNYQLRLHPALGGHYIYEELWHPSGQGYDWQSLHQFYVYLTEKYKTLDALNREWGTRYKEMREIKPPAQSNETACWANFRAFRMWAQCQDVKHPCGLLKELQPDHTTFGAKGDYPTASWYHAEHIGIFGWYSSTIPRMAAGHFKQAPSGAGIPGDCYYAYVDGRKQRDHRPGPKRYTGRTRHHAYVNLLRRAFDGAKSFRFEEYNDDISHYFHRTKQMKENEGITRRWTGELAWFDKEAFDYAEVTADRGPLQQTVWASLMYRLAPLMLPTKVVRPKVACLVTDASYFLGGKSLWETGAVQQILLNLQVPLDILRRPMFDKLNRYDVVFLGPWCEMLRPEDARRLKEYVSQGGRLILFAPGAMRSSIDLKQDGTMPRFGLDALTDCTLRDFGRRRQNPKGNLLARLPGEADVARDLGPVTQLQYALQPAEDATVLARAGAFTLAVMNRQGSVVTLVPSPAARGRALRTDALGTWAIDLVGKLFETWHVDAGARIEGAAKPREITCSVLQGDGTWLVGLTNRDTEPQSFTVKLSCLPRGDYEVVDVTGERPDIIKNAKRELHRKRDPRWDKVEVLGKSVTADELDRRGVSCEIAARQGLVLLIQPARTKVWMTPRDYTLKTLCSAPITVVVPEEGDAKVDALGKRIFAFLQSKKVPVAMKKASQVATRKTVHEVWVKSRFKGVPKDYKGYLCDVFKNEVVETDTHLIVVGSPATNTLARHLGLHESYVYDKVLFDVDAGFPGPGRGVVQTVDTVNLPYYDATDRTRDAILIGGSDVAGTLAAGEAFLKAIADMPEYVPPVVEKQFDVFSEDGEALRDFRERMTRKRKSR